MKSLFKLLSAGIIIFSIVACQPNGNSNSSNELDSVAVTPTDLSTEQVKIVDAFFQDFQEKNDGWTKTTAGHKKLAKAFKEKFVSDLEFAKACASYNTEYQYVDNPIVISESIAPYSKKNGEEGEIKAFDFIINVKLIKPLYNGQKEISVKYEIISCIPSTVEEHWRPYVKNANYSNTFDSFLKNSYDATINLGCYIVADKELSK